MTENTQSIVIQEPHFVANLALDVVDAYMLSKEVISELSAIFEAIEKLAITGNAEAHIVSNLSNVGYYHALNRLDFIDRQIKSASARCDALSGGD
jgi:hypothetical protein